MEKVLWEGGGGGITLCIKASSDQEFCPVHGIAKYFSLRGDKEGPVLILEGGRPSEDCLTISFGVAS